MPITEVPEEGSRDAPASPEGTEPGDAPDPAADERQGEIVGADEATWLAEESPPASVAPVADAEAPGETPPRTAGDAPWPAPFTPERRRMGLALLVSLVAHLPLLALTFGGDGRGLPGLGLPWQARRVEAPDLQVTLAPAPVPVPAPIAVPPPVVVPVAKPPKPPAPLEAAPARAEPRPLRVEPPPVRVEPPVALAPAARPTAPPSLAPAPAATVIVNLAAPEPAPVAAPPKPRAAVAKPPVAKPVPIPEPAVIAVERADDPTWVVPPTTSPPVLVIAEAPKVWAPEKVVPKPQESAEAERARLEQAAREKALEQARIERARQEAARQEAVRQEAAREEAAKVQEARRVAERQEAARQEAARQESARQEAARQEAARQEAARQEAARQEAARQQEAMRAENARVEAQRQAAARQEAARAEAARQEAARLEAGRQEAARQLADREAAARLAAAREVEAKRDAEARREAVLRALGRQLDEEAARRDAAKAARNLPSASSVRRGRLFGRTDPNAELVRYAAVMEMKIQMNMTFDMVREAARQPHGNPMVTVAIRSDGSVESVTFVLSSGVPALDEAIRRVVHSQEHYPPFPPALASEYDVIEIRRTWQFDTAIRMY